MNSTRNPSLSDFSRKLRCNMTKEERHLWYDYLKDLPTVVKRQKVLGHNIVDFYCASAKLVIEIDGSQHYDETGHTKDAERDEYLRSLGLTVKRYSNADINKRFDSVCSDIDNYIKETSL